jgi:hypothetical protein
MTKNVKVLIIYYYSIKANHYKANYKFYNLLNCYMKESFTITGMRAPEIIYNRVDSKKKYM